MEECGTRLTVRGLVALYSVPAINQIHMWFAADWDGAEETFAAREETQDAALFRPEDIDFARLAFPSGRHALRHALSPPVWPTLREFASSGWPQGWAPSATGGLSRALYPLPADVRAINEEPRDEEAA